MGVERGCRPFRVSRPSFPVTRTVLLRMCLVGLPANTSLARLRRLRVTELLSLVTISYALLPWGSIVGVIFLFGVGAVGFGWL